nr:hypothetical protein [uncultured Rhodococcus sp.]
MTAPLVLEHFQSLWAMEDLPFGGPPWTLAEQVAAIAESRFDGLAIDLGAKQVAASTDIAPLLRDYGLNSAVFAFVPTDAALEASLRYAHSVDAHQMVLCAQIFDADPAVAARTLSRWHRRAAAEGIDVQIETHRGTVTNDLRFTSRLLDHLDSSVSLAIDLSHFVCANEFSDLPDVVIEEHLRRVLERAGSVQGRIATRCQVQIPLGYPQHRLWESRFRQWWVQAFASIRAASNDRESVMFCTELGPRPYAWTDRDGREVSDRWTEALVLREWADIAFTESASTPEPSRAPEEMSS